LNCGASPPCLPKLAAHFLHSRPPPLSLLAAVRLTVWPRPGGLPYAPSPFSVSTYLSLICCLNPSFWWDPLLGSRSLHIPSAAFLILICQERPPEFPFFHVTAFEDPLNSFLGTFSAGSATDFLLVQVYRYCWAVRLLRVMTAASCRSSHQAASCPCQTSRLPAHPSHLFPSWRLLRLRHSLTTARPSSQVCDAFHSFSLQTSVDLCFLHNCASSRCIS
jgi:hypothetical protein